MALRGRHRNLVQTDSQFLHTIFTSLTFLHHAKQMNDTSHCIFVNTHTNFHQNLLQEALRPRVIVVFDCLRYPSQ